MPNTGLIKDASPFIKFAMQTILGSLISIVTYFNPNGSYRSVWKSASDLLGASFGDRGSYEGDLRGVYFDGSRRSEAGREARDEQKQEMLWRESIRMAGVVKGDTVLEGWQ